MNKQQRNKIEKLMKATEEINKEILRLLDEDIKAMDIASKELIEELKKQK